MNIGFILILLVELISRRILKRRFPQLYKRIEFLWNVFYSLFITIFCGFLLYAVYDVLTGGVSAGDKVFFVLFAGTGVSLLVSADIFTWVRWVKEKKNGK